MEVDRALQQQQWADGLHEARGVHAHPLKPEALNHYFFRGPWSGPVVCTTSKSDPLSLRSSSRPLIRLSGATERRQSPPLSATNRPYFFSPFRIACTCG